MTSGIGSVASAALINYGDFSVPPTTFTQVRESSATDAVPLYGAPTAFVTGLDFDPTGFVANAQNGNQDITDGQLNFGVTNLSGINSITIAEAGDYTLLGTGTPATDVFAGVIVRVTVTSLNGVAVAPFEISPANASVGFNLVANPGITQPWSLGTTDSIASQVNGQKVTGIDVVIDDQLVASSQAGTTAFIAKKDFTVTMGGSVPEPASCAVLAVGLTGMLARRRRA